MLQFDKFFGTGIPYSGSFGDCPGAIPSRRHCCDLAGERKRRERKRKEQYERVIGVF